MEKMYNKNYYAILGISKDASHEEVKKSYRRLALRYHPDTSERGPGSEERFKEINEAYAVLGNKEKRMQYDAIDGIKFSGLGFQDLFSEPGFSGTPPFFQRPFRCRGRGMGMWRAFSRRGSSIYTIHLSPDEARSGIEKEVLINIGGTTEQITLRIPAGLEGGSILHMKRDDMGQWRRDIYFRIVIKE